MKKYVKLGCSLIFCTFLSCQDSIGMHMPTSIIISDIDSKGKFKTERVRQFLKSIRHDIDNHANKVSDREKYTKLTRIHDVVFKLYEWMNLEEVSRGQKRKEYKTAVTLIARDDEGLRKLIETIIDE